MNMKSMPRKNRKPEIKVGEKFHWWDRDLWHIIDIFKDGDNEMIVLKSWAKYKNRWCYKVESREGLEWFLKSRTYDEVNSKEV